MCSAVHQTFSYSVNATEIVVQQQKTSRTYNNSWKRCFSQNSHMKGKDTYFWPKTTEVLLCLKLGLNTFCLADLLQCCRSNPGAFCVLVKHSATKLCVQPHTKDMFKNPSLCNLNYKSIAGVFQTDHKHWALLALLHSLQTCKQQCV